MSKTPLEPSIQVLVKLGSIAVHVDEMLGPGGHDFDKTAIQQLLNDGDVQAWINQMHKLALLPVKRCAADTIANSIVTIAKGRTSTRAKK